MKEEQENIAFLGFIKEQLDKLEVIKERLEQMMANLDEWEKEGEEREKRLTFLQWLLGKKPEK